MLYAAGVPNETAMKTAPHVGIATVWWEGNPCNMSLLDMGKEVKKVQVGREWELGYLANCIALSGGHESRLPWMAIQHNWGERRDYHGSSR